MKTFWIGDTHFGHNNVIVYDKRPYSSTEEMDKDIIDKWNKKVSDDDIIYFVGDICVTRNKEKIKNYVSQLKGRKILIKGNHDTRPMSFYYEIGFEKVYDKPILLKNKFIVSHRPISLGECDRFFNIFAHVHNHPDFETKTKNSICVSCCRWNYEPIQIEEYDNYCGEEVSVY